MNAGRISNLGNWNVNGVGMALTAEEWYEAALGYIPKYYEDGMPLDLVLNGVLAASPKNPSRYLLIPCQNDSSADNRLVFGCARQRLQLFPDGRPAVCDTLDPSFVGMPPIASDDPEQETTTLSEVLSTGSAFMGIMDLRRSSFLERAADCRECAYLRICSGGCRANSYNEYGLIMDKDPVACAFFKDGWAKRVIDTMRAVRPEATFPLQDDDLFSD